MRLLIGSDFHINDKKRLEDTTSVLNQIVSTTSSMSPNVFICLGDVFDKRRPSPREMQVFNRWLMTMVTLVDKVIILEGNHDQDNGISSLSYIQDLGIKNVAVVSPPIVFPSPENPLFYFGHEQVDGAVADNGIILNGGASPSALIKSHPETKIFGFGHFHKPQIFNKKPMMFYAGSINKVNFSERNDEKKLWFFEDDRLVVTTPLDTRPMFQFDVDVSSGIDPYPWNGVDLNGALVKIVYSGKKSELKGIEKEQEALRLNLSGWGVKDLKIVYNVTDSTSPRNENLTEAVTEEVALKEYFANKDLSENIKKAVIAEGTEIIKECST